MIKFNKQTLASAATCILTIMGLGSHLVVNHLEAELRVQCQSQDWPDYAHDAHVDFCHASGYPVK